MVHCGYDQILNQQEAPKDFLIIHLHFLDLIQSGGMHTLRFRKQ